MEDETLGLNLPPLAVHCTDADCASGLHCFKYKRKAMPMKRGACRYCGAELVNWGRVQQRDLGDTRNTFRSLEKELIRHHFWHKPIGEAVMAHARRKGGVLLREAAAHRLRQSVGSANPPRDGRQTPMDGNIIYFAQHATACCCRTCMEYWHAIPKGRELSDEEIAYFTELVMLYVNERMPQLLPTPEKVPRRTKHNPLQF
jgi:hypothetical protein